jgi:hypothetical protein
MRTINDFKVGQVVSLKPKTIHGKNRIQQHGQDWKVVMLAKTGRFISLNSMNDTWKTHDGKMIPDSRRVDINNDPNFEIEILN